MSERPMGRAIVPSDTCPRQESHPGTLQRFGGLNTTGWLYGGRGLPHVKRRSLPGVDGVRRPLRLATEQRNRCRFQKRRRCFEPNAPSRSRLGQTVLEEARRLKTVQNLTGTGTRTRRSAPPSGGSGTGSYTVRSDAAYLGAPPEGVPLYGSADSTRRREALARPADRVAWQRGVARPLLARPASVSVSAGVGRGASPAHVFFVAV